MGMTGFALWCGFVTLLPVAFSQLVIGALWLAAAGWLIVGVVFGKGDQRAFCLGAAVVVSSMWTSIGGRFIEGFSQVVGMLFPNGWGPPLAIELWLNLVLLTVAAVANGWLCVRARQYFERPSAE